MTALKPTETRLWKAVSSERYPLNRYCASPMSEPGTLAEDPHHIFPRSMIAGDSWFVAPYVGEDGDEHTAWDVYGDPIPHVVGLSREQHERVECHEAWIKLEDGVFNWYERGHGAEWGEDDWQLVGPLDPQPGYAGAPKRRKRKQGEERRKRKTITIRVPDDTEDGGQVWDEALENVKAKLVRAGLYGEADNVPAYEALIAALHDWLTE